MATTPNTLGVAQAIIGFCQPLTYANGSDVYNQVELGEIKDLTTVIANGGACLEVYANGDDSQHMAFGGKITDEQTWILLTIVSLDDAQLAERTIYQARDALVQPFQTHATLGNAPNIYHSQIKVNSGKFVKIFRNGQWLRGHIIELLTRQEWYVPTPPGVIA